MLVVFGHRPYIKGVKGFNLENVGVEVNSRGRIVIDDQFNTSVSNIKCTDDATSVYSPVWQRRRASGRNHVNYEAILGVVFTQA